MAYNHIVSRITIVLDNVLASLMAHWLMMNLMVMFAVFQHYLQSCCWQLTYTLSTLSVLGWFVWF